MKLGTEHINGERIDVEVSADGLFTAHFNDQSYAAKTRVELIDLLKKAVKKFQQQATVDVTVLGLVPTTTSRAHSYRPDSPYELGAGVVHAKLRSRHEREYNTYLLVSDDEGKAQKFKVSGSREGCIARRLTLAETIKYLDLREQLRIATTAVEDFVGAVQIDPDHALLTARKDVVEGGAR